MRLKGSDEWQNRTDYAETFYKRAVGQLPEMQCSKAAAMFLEKELREGDSILDVGCGAGHYLRSLLNRVRVNFRYKGVDATPEFVATARRAWAGNDRVSFEAADIYSLPFGDKEFDIVMCNNVLLHLPSIEKPVAELLRVARRLVLVRTLIGSRSFRVQEVFSKETWPFSTIPVEDEFDESGEPRSFGYENIYSKGYFKAVVQRADSGAEIELIQDTFFDPQAVNRSADTEGLPNATRVIDGMQILGYIVTPYYFALIRPGT